jgi:hypothetical protein
LLHITNGATAASVIRAAGVPGAVLAWNDVLHDGPVPGDVSFNQLRAIRARFFSDSGWRTPDEALREFTERDRALERSLSHDEVVLWFEHDLYDQLQLVQLLDWFATCEIGATRLTLVCDAEYLGPSTPERLAERFPLRTTVTDDQFECARLAWRAFRSDDPRAIENHLSEDLEALPFVNGALRRHLEQFPSTANGLSRAEHQAHDVLADGPRPFGSLFADTQQREDPVYLGDASFAAYLTALNHCTQPLIVAAPGQRVTSSVARAESAVPLELTDLGRAVLAGSADHIALNGIDRWLGGVRLTGPESTWRWDPAARILIATS